MMSERCSFPANATRAVCRAVKQSPASRACQQGLSVIELMVGAAIGLLIVAAGTKLFVEYLTSTRRTLVETRASQELRAAADIVTRGLRRAGHWHNALRMIPSAGAPGMSNPHRSVTRGVDGIGYSYARDDDDAVDVNEQFGYRVSNYVLQARIGGTWQSLTDPGAVRVVGFDLEEMTRSVDLHETCPCLLRMTCTSKQFRDRDPDTGSTGIYHADRPRLNIRSYALRLVGQVPQDMRIVRDLRETIRVRNDEVVGTCPL